MPKGIRNKELIEWARLALPPDMTDETTISEHLQRWSGIAVDNGEWVPVPHSELTWFSKRSTVKSKEIVEHERLLQARLKHLWDLVPIVGIPDPDVSKFDVVDFRRKVVESDGRLTLESVARGLWGAGIPVFFIERPPKTPLEGVAFKVGGLPAICMFSRWDEHKALFYLLHELGHVLCHLDAWDWVADAADPDLSDKAEKQANDFALDFLFAGQADEIKAAAPDLKTRGHVVLAMADYCGGVVKATAGSVMCYWAFQHNRQFYYGMAAKHLQPRKAKDVLLDVQSDFVMQGVSQTNDEWTVRNLLGLPAMFKNDGTWGLTEKSRKYLASLSLASEVA